MALDKGIELDELLDKLIRPIENIYAAVELELLQDIAQRLMNYEEVDGVLAWRIKKLQELGALNKSSLLSISELSGKSLAQVESAIKEIVDFTIDMDLYNAAYKVGQIKINPQNIALTRMLKERYYEAEDMIQLIQTNMVNSTKQEYLRIIDKAYIESTTGIKSYTEAIKDGIVDLSEKGISGATYLRMGKPYEMAIEPVVRRNVLTTLVQSGNAVQQEYIKRLGVEQIAVSQHMGARNKGNGPKNHESWQGKVYDVEDFERITGYGTMLGLAGINCRHSHYPHFKGISPDLPPRIDTEENGRIYDLTQHQRRLERNIRKARKELAIAETIDDSLILDKAKKKLTKSLKAVKQHIKANPELTRDTSREYIQ